MSTPQHDIQPENLYFVQPEKDAFTRIELVLADPGAAGHAAIANHYPDLKLSLDIDQLAVMQERAMNAPMFTTGPYWFKKPYHYIFIAIKDGVPSAILSVEATTAGKAIRRAAKAAPGCLFNIVGLLEQINESASLMMAVLEGEHSLVAHDLRMGSQS